jgi:alpha-N-arabinofuranosidase
MKDWVEYLTSGADTTLANQRRANGRERPWRVKYFGVGNESWGCGGNLTPENYADCYRRYATFVKELSGNKLYRIACGANSEDYNWTRALMERAGRYMQGLSLHYYTLPTGRWSHKGSATTFGEAEWHQTLGRTLFMDQLIARHSKIMDEFDEERRVGMVIDEWGTWCDPEAGTNPSFLYQQNTLRDALVAALNLHIFHAHAERVTMANLAQTVNVLQAVALTDGPELVLTPTYHVLHMLKSHQAGARIPTQLEAPSYEFDEESIPSVSAAATLAPDGALNLSLCNTHATQEVELSIDLDDPSWQSVSLQLLAADELNAHNTFEAPECVRPKAAQVPASTDGVTRLELPKACVAMLRFVQTTRRTHPPDAASRTGGVARGPAADR